MTDTLDTKLAVSIATVGTHVDLVNTLKGTFQDWADEANRIRLQAQTAWEGRAADAFENRAKELDKAADEIVTKIGDYYTAVDTFHSAMTTVESDLSQIRQDAVTAGLTVIDTVVHAPKAPVFAAPPGTPYPTAEENPAVAEYERLAGKWNELVPRHDDIRSTEAQTHNAFQRACDSITAPEGWGRLAAALGFSPEPGDILMHAADATQAGGEAGAAIMMTRFGRFAYRENGRYAKLPPGLRSRADAYANPDFWQNRPNATPGARSKLGFAKSGLKWGSRLGGALAVVGGVIDFWGGASEQWERDSYDPTLSTGERLVRSTLIGTGEAAAPIAGSLLGGVGGGMLGGLIGSAVAPGPGTAIGAVGGGIVGGFIGGFAGNAARDAYMPGLEEWVDRNVRW